MEQVDRREIEAARLAVPETRPGDHPPTNGDEGGGNFYPEPALEERRTLLDRILRRWRNRS